MARITQRQINTLKRAVDLAEDWRGAMLGAAPKEAIDDFDSFIADCRTSLTVVRAMRKQTTQPKPYRPHRPAWGEE